MNIDTRVAALMRSVRRSLAADESVGRRYRLPATGHSFLVTGRVGDRSFDVLEDGYVQRFVPVVWVRKLLESGRLEEVS